MRGDAGPKGTDDQRCLFVMKIPQGKGEQNENSALFCNHPMHRKTMSNEHRHLRYTHGYFMLRLPNFMTYFTNLDAKQPAKNTAVHAERSYKGPVLQQTAARLERLSFIQTNFFRVTFLHDVLFLIAIFNLFQFIFDCLIFCYLFFSGVTPHPAAVLYTAKMAEAAATWPKGISPAEQHTLESYTQRLIGYHSLLNQMGTVLPHWTLPRHPLHHSCSR